MNIKQDILNRANFAFVGVGIVAFAIISRLVYVQFFDTYKGKYWRDRIEGTRIRQDTIRAMRGNIYAADGSVLATSLPSYEVNVDPTIAKDEYFADKADSLGLILARIFKDRTANEYTKMARDARKAGRQYLRLDGRRVTFAERREMLKWPFFRSSRKVAARGGVLRPHYERYHPFGTMAERTVGNMKKGNINEGERGLEGSFDTALAGKPAVGMIEMLSGGYRKPVDDGPAMQPEPGLDLHTTLDVNFQDMAESALRDGMTKFRADKGCVIVMEVATGEIRALANLTRYPGQTEATDQYLETYNHAVATRTDPGSTFKLVSMMALLEEKAVWPGKTVNTGNGRLAYQPVRGRIINIIDPKRNGFGVLTAQQVLEKSSNIGIHLLMKDYFYKKPDLYCQYLRQFRLTLPTNLGMKGEATPFIRTPDSKGWDKYGSLTYMSYGYEMLITPLQMLTFYNAVANNGRWVKPMLVKQLSVGEKVVQEFAPVVLPRPIASIGTIRKVKSMLEGVVHHGTGKKAGSPFYQVAGKSGTAQKNIGGQFQEGTYYSSFIGYFPAKMPKYSLLVGIDNPKFTENDSLYGGKVAAPIFRVVADRIHAYDARMHPPLPANRVAAKPIVRAGYANDLHQISTELGVAANEPAAEGWVRLTASGHWKQQANKPGQVPDVRGLPLRDALFLLENRGLRVSASGRGRVATQSLSPGSPASMGRQVLLTLE